MKILRINQIKLPIRHTEGDLERAIARCLKTEKIPAYRISKKSVDARDKSALRYIYSVDIVHYSGYPVKKLMERNPNIRLVDQPEYRIFDQVCITGKSRPVIIGTGPAGLFCGYQLARAGLNPILVERGYPVHKRKEAVERYFREGVFDARSNVQFGEGGAGTFSDGKLNSSIHDKSGRVAEVLRIFAKHGAPEEIQYLSKPHIGTDILLTVIYNMRQAIEDMGGTFLFETTLVDLEKESDGIHKRLFLRTADCVAKEKLESLGCKSVDIDSVDTDSVTAMSAETKSDHAEVYRLQAETVVLAIGHSARDTLLWLYKRGVPMEPKPFAVGLRIMHPAAMIQESQYGTSEEAALLPAADYKLTHQADNHRAVYSFCMCPGGYVVNASSEEGHMTVNGMSNHKRDAACSNSAIVVNITPEDYVGMDDPAKVCETFGRDISGEEGLPEALHGILFQRYMERLAYEAGNGHIPVQLYGDYKEGVPSCSFGEFEPEILGDYRFANLRACLPTYVNNAIISGIEKFGTRIRGFARKDAILAGVESRTSCPVRILRNDAFVSETLGIYPCGEGAGYAGGITSAAVDGIRVAEALLTYYQE